MNEIETVWLDVVGGAYPVFDAKRGTGGEDSRLTYPDEVPRRAAPRLDGARGRRARRHRRAPAPGRALDRPDAHARRPHDAPVPLEGRRTTSRPARCPGTSSMTVTPPDWRVAAAQGRRAQRLGHLRHARGVVVRVDGDHADDVRPAAGRAPTRSRPTSTSRAQVTHGHLPENDGHGGGRLAGLPDPRELLARPVGGSGKVAIRGFVYGQGDLSTTGRRGRPGAGPPGPRADVRQPRRAAGRSTTRSPPARRPATARRASPTRWPTARSTSTRASSASARAASRRRRTATRGRRRSGLEPGTYTYFCRVHPFMRGAFKVASAGAAVAAVRGAGALTPATPPPADRPPPARAAPRARAARRPTAARARRRPAPPRAAADRRAVLSLDDSHANGTAPGRGRERRAGERGREPLVRAAGRAPAGAPLPRPASDTAHAPAAWAGALMPPLGASRATSSGGPSAAPARSPAIACALENERTTTRFGSSATSGAASSPSGANSPSASSTTTVTPSGTRRAEVAQRAAGEHGAGRVGRAGEEHRARPARRRARGSRPAPAAPAPRGRRPPPRARAAAASPATRRAPRRRRASSGAQARAAARPRRARPRPARRRRRGARRAPRAAARPSGRDRRSARAAARTSPR